MKQNLEVLTLVSISSVLILSTSAILIVSYSFGKHFYVSLIRRYMYSISENVIDSLNSVTFNHSFIICTTAGLTLFRDFNPCSAK